jgi:hypothetical protein
VPSVPPRLLFGMAFILLGVGAVAAPTAFDEEPEAKRVPGNRPINAGALDLADIRANNSPTVVRNPRNGRQLAVANRVDSPRFSCGLNVSRDGGARWRQLPIPAPKGEEPKCYAPDVAYDAAGTLYLSFVTLRGRGNVPNAVWLSRLRGHKLSKPVKLLGRRSFQVRLVADPVKPRRLYLTWLKASDVALYQFSETGNPVSFMRSDDGGRNWGRRVTVSSPRRERVIAPSLAVGADDDLHVLYLDLRDDRLDYAGAHRGQGGAPYPGPWELVAARSGDGGRSWQESVVDPGVKPIERFIVFIPTFPSIAADPDSGRVYASFHDGRLGDPDVLVWSSSDNGDSWSEARRVNDTPERDGRTQYLPEVAVAPNGRVDVLYYDRRRDRRDRRNEVSLQSSFDDGKTFSKHLRLSQQSFSSRIGFGSERNMTDLGSRLGLVSADDAALGVWTDTRAGTRASRKQDLAAGFVTFSRPARLSNLAEAALRYGGILLVLAGVALLASLAAGQRLAALRRPERPGRGEGGADPDTGIVSDGEEKGAAPDGEEKGAPKSRKKAAEPSGKKTTESESTQKGADRASKKESAAAPNREKTADAAGEKKSADRASRKKSADLEDEGSADLEADGGSADPKR